ncbi:hypothetical protein DFH07DRAFT_861341 [Mycena maculata]|uniref:Uncharacterized protein n=1 Tax=Mycena maculata TaxID=230809 RepID=A0AAD7MID1_9AGAR|nr:hypothetical protein DFH07DRAFT_861341 [Mycena maculata]
MNPLCAPFRPRFFPCLPELSMSCSLDPTNALSEAERSRLVRSNRKLQALLGETPQVIEAALASNPRRQLAPCIESLEAPIHPQREARAPPTSSTHSHRRKLPPSTLTLAASDSSRPCLLLHLELPSAPTTPLSPTSSITLNMYDSTPPGSLREPSMLSRSLSSKDIRRRHAAKLARALGENIAPELVAEPATPPPPPPLRRVASTIGRPSRKTALPFRESDDIVFAPSAPSPAKSTSLARSFSTATRTPRTWFVPLSMVDAQEPQTRENELVSGKRRKEKDWSGEWNTEIKVVAKQLRSLK